MADIDRTRVLHRATHVARKIIAVRQPNVFIIQRVPEMIDIISTLVLSGKMVQK